MVLERRMKNEYMSLRRTFEKYYFQNKDGIVSGREYFEIIYAIKSDLILEKLEVQNEMAKFILRQSITVGLSYQEFIISIRRI